MKKLLALMLTLSMVVSLAACGKSNNAPAETPAAESTDDGAEAEAPAPEVSTEDGVHIFMFKSTGNSFGDLMYEGFSEYMNALGYATDYTSPAETTVPAQVQMLDELLAQGNVASITISTNGDTGYDEVFNKAKEAGIPIISIDSEASVDYRLAHINQANTQDIGSYLVQAAVLITLGIDYPADGNMKNAVETALADYSGDEIVLGVLSASIDTPVQNSWIKAMEVELTDPVYEGKVSPALDKKYGNDDPVESTNQANAFVAENKVDCIISPTTVGIAAAGTVLGGSDIKLTGLGLPSEMQGFMPLSPDDDAFEYVCPYMMLWDVIHLGAVAGAAQVAAMNEGWTGTDGETFTMNAFRDYAAEDYTVYSDNGGTYVLAGTPYIFDKNNMEEWIPRL